MKYRAKLTALLLGCCLLSVPTTLAGLIEPNVDLSKPSTNSDSEDEEGVEGEEEDEEEAGYAGVFLDLENHWAEEIVTNLYQRGLVNGTSETMFSPDVPMTRAEFITVVVRYIYPTAEYYDGTYWYSGFFETAFNEGILPMTYREKYMEEYITRQEMAYIMVHALADMGEEPEDFVSTKTILDYSTVGSNYRDKVLSAYSLGIMGGKTDGLFYPHEYATRAECAVVIENMVDPEARIEVEFPVDPNAMTDMNRMDVNYTKTRDTMTYSITDPNRPVAKVGDIVIISNKEVEVIAHPTLATANGMPVPYVAGQSLDLGINTNSGHGIVADNFSGGGIHYNGESYYVHPLTKVGYWESQWKGIQTRVTAPRFNGTVEGEVSTDEYKMYRWNVSTRDWEPYYLYGRD